jgi:TfoX/Sxy family transcriptional regulator of competence genes
MEWKKAPEELVEFLAEKMKVVNCDYRKMFGYPAYFINGNMFGGIHGEKLFLRLSESDVGKIMKGHSNVTFFEPMPNRPMKGYVVLPKSVYENNALFSNWLEKSVEFVATLPPKSKKKK